MATSTDPKTQEIREILGKNCKARRDQIKLTQTALGKAIGYSKSFICDFERGKSSIPAEYLPQLAAAIDSTIVELYTYQRYYKDD